MMKKVLIALFFLGSFGFAANAQQADAVKPKMTKEEKAQQKQKDDDNKAAAYKEVGLTADQIAKVTDANTEANKQNGEIRKDATLADDAKKAKLDEISKAKNEKIKEIMGADKYKQFNAIRKQQRQATEPKQ